MTKMKSTNGLLTDRLHYTDQNPINLTNNRQIETHQWLMTNFTRVFQPIPSWLNWPVTFNRPNLWHQRLPNTIHLTLKMTSAQVVEMSVTNNSSFQSYPHPDDHTAQTNTCMSFVWLTMFHIKKLMGMHNKETYTRVCIYAHMCMYWHIRICKTQAYDTPMRSSDISEVYYILTICGHGKLGVKQIDLDVILYY